MIYNIISKMNPSYSITSGKEPDYLMNEAISFDIESTSMYIGNPIENKKFAFMYGWTLDINDMTILGRTWDEFVNVCTIISSYFSLNIKKRIVIFIHNFSFEFQFLKHYFKWYKIFATDVRKPLYAISNLGIEFRCSYRLSGYSLAKIGEQVGIEKSKDLDYLKIRHYRTELKPEEKQYMVIDVKIVSEYIRRKIIKENGIAHIPLTKTGYVRRLFRNKCLHGEDTWYYLDLMSELKLTLNEYEVAKKAFAGGFTHANYRRSMKKISNVVSYDLTSSYPTVLVAEKYPMSKGVKVEIRNRKRLEKEMYSDESFYILQIELEDVKPKFFADNYISRSKCIYLSNDAVINNGRVYSASNLVISITNIDYQIIDKCYKFNVKTIANCYRYMLDYMPKPFVETLFELYMKKTTLKDVIGKEEEYLSSKEDINSAFGMSVTDIVRDIIEYSERSEWSVNGKPQSEAAKLTDEQKEEQLKKENNKKGRFLFYLWGVATTAYARRNLWSAIFELGGDYIYSDTDSVKFINEEKHMEYFEKYNEEITEKINTALRYHNLSLDYAHPKTIEGIEKPLGVWDFDGHYSDFKTLGAKRYFMKYSNDERNNKKKRGHYVLTVAGLSKKNACEYLSTHYKDPFKAFKLKMYIPANKTGKLTHTYIDKVLSYEVTDYTGITKRITCLSSVHLEPCDYEISDMRNYSDFLKGIRDRRNDR